MKMRLEYGQRRSGWYRRPRWIGLIAFAVVLGVVGRVWGPGVWDYAKRRIAWNHCWNLNVTQGTVTYDDDATRIPELLKSGDYVENDGFWRHVAWKVGALDRLGWRVSNAKLFVGARLSPDGRDSLLVLELWSADAFGSDEIRHIDVFGAWLGSAMPRDLRSRHYGLNPLRIQLKEDESIRIFFATPDPKDPTKISFDIEVGKRKTTFTIAFASNGAVVRSDDGRCYFDRRNFVWSSPAAEKYRNSLEGAPTTRP